MNRQAIAKLYANYHSKVNVQPNLYVQPQYVQVVLPAELREFANAAAGHGNGGDPVGIRRMCDNPSREISRIFSSVDTLEQFIRSSECNAMHTVTVGSKPVKMRVAKKRRPVSVRSGFWSNYSKFELEELKLRFGYETILAAFNSKMTFDEFKLKFNLR